MNEADLRLKVMVKSTQCHRPILIFKQIIDEAGVDI